MVESRKGHSGRQAVKKAALRLGRVSKGVRPWQIGLVSGSPKVSFLVPAHNEAQLLGRALESIHRSAAGCGLEVYEIVVCDNASTDATASIAAAAGARVVSEPHRQIARARNAAAAASEGEWLIWIDADAVLAPEVLAETVSSLRTGRVCGGGACVAMEGRLGWLAQRSVAAWNWIARNGRLAAGSYFFALRQGWTDTGGFDESVYAGEELGFAKALKRWGRKRGLSFDVIGQPVVSSARKFEHFSSRDLLLQMLLCAWPGNRARRDRCGFWYERPGS